MAHTGNIRFRSSANGVRHQATSINFLEFSMSATIVVGGQFGGEGKGAVMAYLTETNRFACLVKTGGPNAWHNYGYRGDMHDVRMFPSGATLRSIDVVFPPGALIHVPTLLAEKSRFGISGRVIIDPLAGIIDELHVASQQADPFYVGVGSSRRGTGAASATRALRRLRLARDEPSLQPWLVDTSRFFARCKAAGSRILIEGGQGFGLSNYHGDYPYSTSRDTTVAAFLSQCGLAPAYVDSTVLAIKCLPTRNPEGHGRLADEISIGELESLSSNTFVELSGTPSADGRRVRRIGLFDFDLLERAVFANSPAGLAVTGFDRLEAAINLPKVAQHYGSIAAFRAKLETVAKVPIILEGWGPHVENMVVTQEGIRRGFAPIGELRQRTLTPA